MSIENNKLVKALMPNLTLMSLMFVFPKSFNQQIIFGFAHFMLASLVPVFYFLALVIGNFNFIRFISTGCLVLQMFTLTFKFIPFIFNRRLIDELLQCLRSDIFTNCLPKQEYILEETNYIVKRNFYIYSTPIASSLACVVVSAYVLGALPFDAWIPYDISNSTAYWFTFTFMSAGICRAAVLNASTDTLISGVLCYAVAQIRILKTSIEGIVNDESKEVYPQIIKCCKHYDAISNYVRIVEDTLSWVVFAQLIGSVTVVGLSCIRVILIKDSFFDIFTSVSYILAMISQLFLFCYYGNLIFDESTSVSSTIFMTQWYNYDARSKVAIQLLIERLKKPLIVKAGKTLDLSLETFIMILKKAYSFLAVINSKSEILLN